MEVAQTLIYLYSQRITIVLQNKKLMLKLNKEYYPLTIMLRLLAHYDWG